MAKSQNKESKDEKDKSALVGRIRKVVKKSRRKLGEAKFEKELQRTISFLTELRDRLNEAPAQPAKAAKPVKAAGNGKDKTAKAAVPAVQASTGAKASAKPNAPAKAPAKVKAAK